MTPPSVVDADAHAAPPKTQRLDMLSGTGTRTLAVVVAGLTLLAVTLIIHLGQGAANIAARTIIDALLQPRDELDHHIVRHLRLPRAVAGILAGALVATSGVLMQTVTRNPLASPTTLGVNAGAFLAVVAVAALLPGMVGLSGVAVAFTGGLAAAALVLVVSGGSNASPVRLALAGMAIAMALSAGSAVLQILFEQRTAGLFFWGAGTLLQNGWGGIQKLVLLALVAFLAAWALSRALDVVALGDDTAHALGQQVGRTRVIASLVAVLLAACAVSLVGPIGFVGLVAPHLVRLGGVRSHAARIPAAAVWGAVIVLAADVMGRWIGGPLNEVPAGIVTALVGAPALVLLARRMGGHDRPDTAPSGPAKQTFARRVPYAVVLTVATVGLLTITVLGIRAGAVAIPLNAFVDMLFGAGNDAHLHIVTQLRLPRVLVAALAGAALATSGLLLQGVVRNPLAAPELTGVTVGAGLGAMTVLLLLPAVPTSFLPVAALVGAVAAFALVYGAAWHNGGVTPERLALVGIGVSAVGMALVNLLVVGSDMRLARALVWLSGSTYASEWGDVHVLGLWLLVLVPLSWIVAHHLDLMALGDDGARGVGLPVERARAVQLGLAVLLASTAVATVGTVGFVGLVAPHAARLLTGDRHRRLVPMALILGATLLITADLVGRIVLPPKQIPSGLVAALIGAPYFIWLLARSRSTTYT